MQNKMEMSKSERVLELPDSMLKVKILSYVVWLIGVLSFITWIIIGDGIYFYILWLLSSIFILLVGISMIKNKSR